MKKPLRNLAMGLALLLMAGLSRLAGRHLAPWEMFVTGFFSGGCIGLWAAAVEALPSSTKEQP